MHDRRMAIGARMRLTLGDQGEGWFWDRPSVDVEVLSEVREHSRLFYRVAFAEPVEAPEAGERAGPDGAAAPCAGAWLSPRWVGHEVGRDGEVAVLLWMVRDVGQAVRPPRDVDYSARVKCREID